MLRLWLVLTAYILTYGADYLAVSAPSYYLTCSSAYLAISMIALWIGKNQQSKLLFAYSAGNIIAAYLNWLMVDAAWYGQIKYAYWHAPINFSLILDAMDFMLVFTGAIGVFGVIVSSVNPNISHRLSNFCGLGFSK